MASILLQLINSPLCLISLRLCFLNSLLHMIPFLYQFSDECFPLTPLGYQIINFSFQFDYLIFSTDYCFIFNSFNFGNQLFFPRSHECLCSLYKIISFLYSNYFLFVFMLYFSHIQPSLFNKFFLLHNFFLLFGVVFL